MNKNSNKKIEIFYNYLLIPTLLLISMYLTFAFLTDFPLQTISVKSFVFTLIIIDILNVILMMFVKSSKKAYMIIFIFVFLIMVINKLKLLYAYSPLFVSDINFLGNYRNIFTFTKSNIVSSLFISFIKFIPFILILIFLYYLSSKVEMVFNGKKNKYIGVTLIFILLLVLYPSTFGKEIFFNFVYKDVLRNDFNVYSSYVTLYNYYGIIGGMHFQMLNSMVKDKPKDYDRDKLEKLENSVKNKKSKNIGKPNIIVILSESFFDVDKLKDNITFDKKITKNYNELKNKGKLVSIVSPGFGCMTSNISFEVLTGGNVSFLDFGTVPFLDFYKDKKRRVSLVNELKEEGYDTTVLLGEDSYNSTDVMKSIGFDKFILENDKKYNKGLYVSDDHIADVIINNMKKSRSKKFIFAETMQSHMLYYKEKYSKYDISVKSSNLESKYQDILLSYAQGIYDADKMLKKMYDYINSTKEDTILIFFGDHLPFLTDKDNKDIYPYLDYFNTNDSVINTFRKYNTEALILSNYNVSIDFSNYAGYEFLLSNILNNMDIEIDPYYRWLYSTREVLPTYNYYIGVSKNGSINTLDKLPKLDKDMYNLREKMFYKEFLDVK